MRSPEDFQQILFAGSVIPEQTKEFPRFRYMGSKFRLIPWIHDTLQELSFQTSVDAFSGSGVVSYLLKSMGKQVHSNDSLVFPTVLTKATIANNSTLLTKDDILSLLNIKSGKKEANFIEKTFSGIFYTPEELKFLDNIWCGLRQMTSAGKRVLALAALLRSAVKRQPRGLFTVAGDPERYKDGRRDLQLTLREHFIEQADVYNRAVFDNKMKNRVTQGDVFMVPPGSDLVYMDPPYVPNSDDNCYIKRYHFLEGLSCYWEDKEIMLNSKVRKIAKPYTPFSYK